jgi:hypothetical protein
MGDLLVWALKLDPSLHQDNIGKLSSKAFDWCNKSVVVLQVKIIIYKVMSLTYQICFIYLPIPVMGPEGPSMSLVLSW